MKFFNRSYTVGLDIERSSLKAAQVSTNGGEYVLEHVGYRRLADGAVVEGEVSDGELLASELRSFWEDHSFRGRSVYLGLANQRVVARTINLPRMEERDLAGAIRFEAQDHIPMPVEEAILDHAVLGPSPDQSDLDRVLLVAAEAEMVRAFTRAVRDAGLRTAGVDVRSLSLVRSLLPETIFGEEQATLLLDVAAEMSSLVICEGERPSVVRLMPGGSDALVRAVARNRGCSLEEAEELLSDLSLDDRYSPEEDDDPDRTRELPGVRDARSIRPGVESALGALAADLRSSIGYHESRPAARPVGQAIVCGEGAMIPGFEEYLERELGVRVSGGLPLQKISANESNLADEDLRLMDPVMAPALGLAIEDA